MTKKIHIRPEKAVKTALVYLLVLLVSFIFAFPCVWLVLSAFNAEGDLLTLEGFFPQTYSFDTFRRLFTEVNRYDYPRWFGNTLFVAAVSCVISTFLVIAVAYTISRSGSDWTEIYIIDAESGRPLDDHIVWAKFTDAAWHGEGFYYSAYDAPVKGKEYSNVNENHKIYYHKIGTPQQADRLVYENKAYPKRFYTASVSKDETVMFIYESGAGAGNALYVKDLRTPDAPLKAMAYDMDYTYYPVEVTGGRIYLMTNNGAPKYRIMAATLDKPDKKNYTFLRKINPGGDGA